ncbi:ABC transporter permease subunit [Jeotgalibacillus proteolyticus]|uniref:ABC transporter permease subunit n=1 Tax=Jeotgalibacillus proteolyticus TaxID=2082395 RepID=UPI003CF275D9
MTVKILKLVGVWVLAFSLLLIFLLVPRTMDIQSNEVGAFVSPGYTYSFSVHWDNIQLFFTQLMSEEGLGMDRHNQPLLGHAWEMMQRSLWLIVPALVLSFVVGIAKGVFDFSTRNSRKKPLGLHTTWLGLSIPDLFIIVALQMGFMYLNVKGIVTGLSLYGYGSVEIIIVNIFYLSLFPAFYIAKATYTALSAEQGQDYIRTARGKGIAHFKILYVHMLKNGLAHVFLHTNTMVLYVLSNLFVVEFLTQYRGAAYYFKKHTEAAQRIVTNDALVVDVGAVVAFTFFFTVLILISSIISQVARSLLVPIERGDEA